MTAHERLAKATRVFLDTAPVIYFVEGQFIGAAGYDLGILGVSLASGSKTLFTQKKQLLRTGQCPPPKSARWVEDALTGWEAPEFGDMAPSAR